jgi:hypothetical protein
MAICPPDWSVHWRAGVAGDDPRSAAAELTDWLAGQRPAVWHALARDYLDLDLERGEAVAAWIIDQPACDRATAALILFRLDPAYYLMRQRLELDHPQTIVHPLIAAILANLGRGHYRDSLIDEDLAGFGAALAAYRLEIERFAARRRTPAFVLPEALVGPFEGAAAAFPEDADPYDNPRMWALIERVGRAGLNRASAAWQGEAEAAWRLWLNQRANDGWLKRQLRQPALIILFGPDFASEGERQRYLSGDETVARALVERARAAARIEARRDGRQLDLLRLSDWPELPWQEVRDALAAALPRFASPISALTSF